VILVLLLIGCPFLLAFHRLLRSQQMDALGETTATLSRVVVASLASAMLVGQPHLLDETIRDLSDQEEVEKVILLDHEGRIRVSSDPSDEGTLMDRERYSTCRACHGKGVASPATRTATTVMGDRQVFRTMSVIPNEPRCHGCHDPAAATNGILLMDLSLSTANRRFFADIGSTVALGAVMVLVTIAVLALLLRRMVHGPLQAVVSTSRRIVGGDLDARVSVSSQGEFAVLASHLNRMTDHLAESLRTVETQSRQLQSILDAIDDEIVVLDRERRVVAANRAFLRAGEPVNGPLAGQHCRDVSASRWPCDGDQPDGCPVQRVFDSGRLQKGLISRSESDGTERAIEIHASPLRGPDGSVSHAVEVRRDISERRQLEATLAHSERLASLGLLASGLSHEINNPLGAIATSVDGLRRRLANDDSVPPEAARRLEQVLSRIAREVQRGRTITNRLLKVARPPGGTRSLVDVNHVVEDILAVLAHDLKRHRIKINLELAGGLPPLPADESRIGQVVMNLGLNAIQAMAETGGQLRIATNTVDGVVQIEVEDTGCGIPPSVLNRIYEPFFTTKPVGKGTGLGLFITHQIVSEMGGTIQVRSQPGQGTCLTVRIPRGRSEARS
jgi:signal transduction histidine kinase/HAMP domain-containing protein